MLNCQLLPPTNTFLLLGVVTSVSVFVKIDQSATVQVRTHGQRQTGVIIGSMLLRSNRADINTISAVTNFCELTTSFYVPADRVRHPSRLQTSIS